MTNYTTGNVAVAQPFAGKAREEAVLWINIRMGEIRLPYGVPLTPSTIAKDANLSAIYQHLHAQGPGTYENEAFPNLSFVIPGKIKAPVAELGVVLAAFTAV